MPTTSLAHRIRHALAALAVAAMLAPARTGAQAPPSGATDTAACLAAIPASAMRPTAVLLSLDPPVDADEALRTELVMLGRELARAVRDRMGGTDTSIALVDSTVSWRRFDPGITLVLSARESRVVLDSAGSPVVQARLRPILDSIARSGPAFIWPEGWQRETLRIPVGFEPVAHDADWRPLPPREDEATYPVFAVRHPWSTPAATVANGLRVEYPRSAVMPAGTGYVVAQFDIGPDGRTVRGSFVERRRRDVAGLPDYLREAYLKYVGAVRTAVEDGRFTPRMVGGCPVRSTVTQHFSFQVVEP